MSTKATYEHILRCREHTQDAYWKDIIFRCAYNRFPKGLRYNSAKNTLYVRTDNNGRSKMESLPLPTDPYDSKACFNVLMTAFKHFLQMRSENDVKLCRSLMEQARKRNDVDLNCEWKKLKPRTVKNHILMNYAIHEIDKYKLDNKKVSLFYKFIQLGFQFKKLSQEHIEYKNGVISNISGIAFNKETNFFEITNKQSHISHSTTSKAAKNELHKSIEKWIKTYKTFIVKI